MVASSAADALWQVLRRPVHGLPRRVTLRRPRRLLHAPRRLRPGHRQYTRTSPFIIDILVLWQIKAMFGYNWFYLD